MRGSHPFAPSLILVVLAGSAVALAGPLNPPQGPAMFVGPASPSGGPDEPSFPGVLGDETASVGLKVYANPSVSGFINAGGDQPVMRGATHNIGSGGAYGTYNVQASWDEFVGTNTNIIQVVWKTSNSQRFVPSGALVGGLPVQFLEWRFGVTDPVMFGPWVTGNSLVAATISSSTNGGQTLQNFDITASVTNPWNGTVSGTTLPISFFNNANYIQLTVEYVLVPAPGAVAVVAGAAGLIAVRRRRPVS